MYFSHIRPKIFSFCYPTDISSICSGFDLINARCYQYLMSGLRESEGRHRVGVVECVTLSGVRRLREKKLFFTVFHMFYRFLDIAVAQ